MDALVKATIDSLKKILPELQKELATNHNSLETLAASALPGLLMESHELIDLLMQRVYTQSGEATNQSSSFLTDSTTKNKGADSNKEKIESELIDEDALVMMQMMD